MTGIPDRVKSLIREVCGYHGINPRQTLERPASGQCTKKLTKVRHEIWHRIRTEIIMADGLPPSYPRIGSWFGMHHTTILEGVSRHKQSELEGVL